MTIQSSSEPIAAAEAAELFSSSLSGATGILIAVSGGPDSMALMALLAEWADKPALSVATVDHGLRPESQAEALLVKQAAQKLALPHDTLIWSGQKPSHGIQVAAREVRYQLLLNHATSLGLSHVALAHHADDQAETVLMRLAAGSGITGVGGMAVTSQREGITLARPLLSLPKERLIATCQSRGIGYVEDPSNRDPKYGRTRVRDLLRQVSDEGLTPERLTVFANRARRASEALDSVTTAAVEAAGFQRTPCLARANWHQLAQCPTEIRLRALIKLTQTEAVPAPPVRLERFETLLDQIDLAFAARQRLRQSMGDSIVTLQSDGTLLITQAPPRKRGRRSLA